MIQVTLRSEGALNAIASMAHVPGAIVGVGTVFNDAQLAQVWTRALRERPIRPESAADWLAVDAVLCVGGI